MAKNTISMKSFRSKLTKISRLAKSGYNSITSVAKQIIATVTQIASKISVVSENSQWQGGNESLPSDYYQNYYENASRAEEAYLARSLDNLDRYKDDVIVDLYTISNALEQNSEQMGYMLADAVTKAFGKAADDFFESGVRGGESFGNGFVQSVEKSMEQAKSVVLSSLLSISPMIEAQVTGGGATNVTYSNPSYNFYASGQTVTEQLAEARIAETVNSLRKT